ncbi:hypothetical protein BCR44DRAFT_52658 [Catenaria anguillulae PL171]|uniref:Poly A polymerase head domain-containing protein n=1 Tax=Catenaria anguillulae PL171 TaxID=765915 RepID=A0A1Y2HAY2_9FUNG|nr:hypothetical protein BCR44DRAFT_52658 [Catenaria anguillulae PL171]
MTSSSPPMPASIALSRDELRLFRLLNAVCSHSPKPVVPRVAGGWVRDKLLGNPSDDLDIALDTYMGYDFATLIADFVRTHPDLAHAAVAQQPGEPDDPQDPHGSHAELFAGLAKIQSNPDKSKHLETATCRVLGYDLDFVNLRSETYQEHSRIPAEVGFGSPVEDALRRDCTINALFYNIATGQVEDFTHKGIEDLHRGVIRTPLDPKDTFHDDPLRVLRSVRFAARLGFKLDPDLIRAVKDDDEVHDALANKISKERIGVELHKMMTGPGPAHAVSMLSELKVWRTVCLAHFNELELLSSPLNASTASETVSLDAALASIDLPTSATSLAVLEWLTNARPDRHLPLPAPTLSTLWSPVHSTTNIVRTTPAPLAALTLPLAHLHCSIPRSASIFPHTTKKPQVLPPPPVTPLAAHVVKINLKLTNRDADWVAHAHACMPAIQHAAGAYGNSDVGGADAWIDEQAARGHRYAWTEHSERERVVLGNLVRACAGNKAVLGEWRAVAAVALVAQVAHKVRVQVASESLVPSVVGYDEDEVAQVVNGYVRVMQRINELRVDDVWGLKHVINGIDAAKTLGVPKGPLVRDALDWVTEYQLARPQGTADECREWLKANWQPGFVTQSAPLDVGQHQVKREHTPDPDGMGKGGIKKRKA